MNKKVKHAVHVTYDNIEFKSKLEMFCYKYFKEKGLKLNYESLKIPILSQFEVTAKLYLPQRKSKKQKGKISLKEARNKILGMNYTPDFTLKHKNKFFIIECKGKPNDVYPYKRKFFFRWLCEYHKQNNNVEIYFFEPHSQFQIMQTFNLIKDLI